MISRHHEGWDAPNPVSPGEVGAAPATPQRGHVILLVDGDEARRDLLRRLLVPAGYVLREVASGTEALASAGDGVDLVLLDLHLPDLSGFEVCARLKVDLATAQLPVLMLSARFTEIEHKASALASGADGFLTSTLEPEVLLATLGAWLRSRALTRRSAERLERLYEVASALAAALTPRQVGEIILGKGAEAFGADNGLVATLKEEGVATLEVFDLRSASGAGVDVWSEHWRRGRPLDGTTPLDLAFQTGEALFLGSLEEYQARLGPMATARARSFGIQASVSLPLSLEGRKLGACGFTFRVPRTFDPQERRLALTFARQCALALDRARLYAADLHARERAQTLAREASGAQEVLRLSNERFRTALVGSGVVVFQLDAELRCEWLYNAPVSSEIILGRTPLELLPRKEDGERVMALLRWGIQCGAGVTVDVSIHVNAEERFFQLTLEPRKDADGRVLGLIGAALDITERKRTEELQQRLMGIVGHDLRNPLSAISTTAFALARMGLSPAQEKAVSLINTAADRMTRIIRDLLLYTGARVGGGIPMHPGPMDAHPLCARLCEELEAAWPGRKVEFVRSGDGHGVWDADRLGQVISNLLSNALKYSPGSSTVRVESHGQADGWHLVVHNDGPPIPTEMLPHLFKPFRRGAQASEAGRESLGLGLYIANEIAKAHRGSVLVHSTASEGTTFKVQLPR